MTRNQYEQHKQRLEERRRAIADLEVDVREALPHLPETFTRRDVCRALGDEPDRGSLYRILQELVQKGSIGVQSVETGQIPTVYRKNGVLQTPEPQ